MEALPPWSVATWTPGQSPLAGEASAEVKTIRSELVPSATKSPLMVRPVPEENLTSTPGSMVNV